MLEHPKNLEACHELIDHLQVALEWRDVIGQAKGILMAAEGCDADTAFGVLVRASQQEGRKIHEMAAAVVAAHCEEAGTAVQAHPTRSTPTRPPAGEPDATSRGSASGHHAGSRHLALVRD